LLLFFIPGVIAFVVDFSTGAIYLPPEGMGAFPYSGSTPPASGSRAETSSAHATSDPSTAPPQEEPLTWHEPHLKRVLLPRPRLQPRQIEDVVANETGREISLDHVDTRLSELSGIDRYDEQLARHRRDRNFGHSFRAFFSQIITT
jgi:hypothetical protein